MDLIDLAPDSDKPRNIQNCEDWTIEGCHSESPGSSAKMENSRRVFNSKICQDHEQCNWKSNGKTEDDFSLLEGLLEFPSVSSADPFHSESCDALDRGLTWESMDINRDDSDFLCSMNCHSQLDNSIKMYRYSNNENDILVREKPPLSRRKSNPFYSPSRQILAMVGKRKRNRSPTVMRSQSSSTILTLRQTENHSNIKRPVQTTEPQDQNDESQFHRCYQKTHSDAGSSGSQI